MSRDVRDWLARFDLSEHLQSFVDNEIDLDAARDLNEQDLRELGLAMGPRKKLLRAIAALNDGAATIAPEEESAARPAVRQPAVEAAGERREVTVLFADICSYTKLTGQMDAEAVHAMLTAYFEAADSIVESFGGSVDKHIGDSVMAVFGAPVSHGNDPERAVRAAAAIHEAMQSVSQKVGLDIKVHIGVASGQVVASGVGAHESYTVTGESVNLASRLTDHAGPSQTLLSDRVRQAVEASCQVEDLGSLSLKGLADPVHAFRVLSLADTESRSRSRPFVGRQAELQQVGSVLTTTADTATGHVIYLRGEAGIGKTRVTEEIEALAAQLEFSVHRALVLDFGAGKGQDAIRSLVRSLLSVTAGSSQDDLQSAVDEVVEAGIIDQDQVVFLYDLLTVPQPAELRSLYSAMDNVRRNQGKCETVAGMVSRISETRKLVLIVEDVHWAEKIVLDHLAELTRVISESPAVLVMTSRLEGDPINDSWRGMTGSTPIITIDLRPLRQADAIAMASEFFDATDKFARSCVERADGNPLFLEQLLRGAEAATENAVPGSIQSIVQARVDDLAPDDKQAIQAAAILGQRFMPEALQHLTEDRTYTAGRLMERHLIRPDGNAFLFAHALVRDAVYNSLLTASRNRLHERAADWYEDRDPALSAQHLDRAGNPRAATAYLRAARDQEETLHFESAIELCTRGLELASQPDETCDLNRALADALLNTRETERAIATYRAAAQVAPDGERRARSLSGLAAALRIADQHTPAFEALDEAEKLAAVAGLTAELAYIHYLRGNLCFPLGRIDECMAEHSESLRLAQQIQSPRAEAMAQSGLADAYYLQGHMQTACERFKACVALCQQHGFGQIEVSNRHMIGWSRIHLMEFREALEDGLASDALATEVRNERSVMLSKKLAGVMHYQLGDLTAAERYLLDANTLAESMGSANLQAQGLRQLAMLYKRLGDHKRAGQCADQALSAIRQVGMTFIGPTVLAACAMVTDDPQEERAFLDEAEEILESGCVAHNHLWFADIAIDLALDRRDWPTVLRYADQLERHTAAQPLAWSIFMARRARALAAAGSGQADASTRTELQALIQQAESCGLVFPLHALKQALAD